MPLQKTEIIAILEANYSTALALMTDDLAAEFKRKIITHELLEGYAENIFVAMQIKDEVNALRIQNWVAERFNKGGFGKKLRDNGIDPIKVYESILAGFFDYRK